MKSDVEKFEDSWKIFIANITGELKECIKKSKLTLSYANILLRDVSLDWKSDITMTGVWLDKYSKDNYEKAKKIEEILTKEITFEKIEESENDKSSKSINIIAPLVGGTVGYGVGRAISKNSLLLKTATTGIGVVTTLCAINNSNKTNKDNDEEDKIKKYVSQLDKYKLKVIDIINE